MSGFLVAIWLVMVEGLGGVGPRVVAWYLGPFAALSAVVMVVACSTTRRTRTVLLGCIGGCAAAVTTLVTLLDSTLIIAHDALSFLVPLAFAAILAAEIVLTRGIPANSTTRPIALLLVVVFAATVCALIPVASIGLAIYLIEAPNSPSAEYSAKTVGFSVEVRPTWETSDNAVFVHSGSGPLQRERRVASASTFTALPEVRFEAPNRISMRMPSCWRTLTVDPATLDVIDDSHEPDQSGDGPSPSFTTC